MAVAHLAVPKSCCPVAHLWQTANVTSSASAQHQIGPKQLLSRLKIVCSLFYELKGRWDMLGLVRTVAKCSVKNTVTQQHNTSALLVLPEREGKGACIS